MMQEIIDTWLQAKEAERKAIELRRRAEDDLVAAFGIDPTVEGTINRETDVYKVKIEPRLDRKVDAGKLIDLAAEQDLNAHLETLFRWTPDLNMTAWKAADPVIRQALSGAITVRAGRPSFKITPKE
jgi:hypothetical protein